MITAMFLCALLSGANSVQSPSTLLAWEPPPDSLRRADHRDWVSIRRFDSLAVLDLPKQPTAANAQAFLEKWLPKASNHDEVGFLLGRFHCQHKSDLCLDYSSHQQVLAWLDRTFRTESRQSFRDALAESNFLSGAIRFRGWGRSVLDVRPGDTVHLPVSTFSEPRIPAPASVSFEVGRVGFHGRDTVEVVVCDTIRAFPTDERGILWQLEDTLPGPGLFRLTQLENDGFQDVFVNSTRLEASVLRSGKSLLVFVTSFDSTLKGPFRMVARFPDKTWQEMWTDSNGLARLELSKEYDGNEIRLVLEGGGNVAFAADPYRNQAFVDWGGFLWSDRPVYRPGDLVHLGGTVLGVDERGKIRRFNADSVVIEVKTLRLSRDVVLNASRQISDTIRIPESQPSGKMEACMKATYRDDDRSRSSVREGCVEWLVESVRKPAFEVVAIPRMEATVQGDSAVLGIQSRYLDGSPVVGGIARISWRSAPEDRTSSYGRRATEGLEERTVALDVLGKANVKIPTLETGEVWDMPVTIAVTDPAQRVEKTAIALPVWTNRLKADVEFSPKQPGMGDSIHAVVVLRSNTFQPEAGWIRFRHLAAGDVVLDTLVRVEETGVCRLGILPRATEQERLELASSTNLSAPWALQSVEVPFPSDRVQVRVDFSTVSGGVHPGDTARMVARNLKPGQSVLATVEKGELLRYEVLRANESGIAKVSIPVDPAMFPRFLVRVWHANREKIDSDREDVSVEDSSPDRGLSLEVPSESAPGAMVVARIRLRDRLGHPTGGRFSLSVADDAIWQLPSEWEREDVTPKGGVGERMRILGNLSVSENRWRVDRELWYLEVLNRRIQTIRERGAPSAVKPSKRSVDGTHPEREVEAVTELSSRRDRSRYASVWRTPPSTGTKPRVRYPIRDFTYWSDSVVIGADGIGEGSVRLPRETANWRFVVRGMDDSGNFHERVAQVDSRDRLLVDLKAPRFLVETDIAWIGGHLRNQGAVQQETKVAFDAESPDGHKMTAVGKALGVPPGSSVDVGWPVVVAGGDSLVATVHASTDRRSENLRVAIPVRKHGEEHVSSRHGRLDSTQSKIGVDLALSPNAESACSWQLRASAGVIPSLREPLKYLEETTHAGLEQTVSRFLSRLQGAGAARRAGIPEDSLEKSLAPSDSSIIERIGRMKGSQQGWGWWEGADPDPNMTVLALDGLRKARTEIAKQPSDASKRLVESLDRMLKEESYLLMRLVQEKKSPPALRLQALMVMANSGMEDDQDLLRKELAEIWEGRDSLGAVSDAFALEAGHGIGFDDLEKDALDRIRRRTITGKSLNGSYELRHWPMDSSWGWAGDSVEATALVLSALARTGNDSSFAKPTIAWLQEQRKNGHWGSTRATARALEAILVALGSSSEAPSRGTLKIFAGKRLMASAQIDGSKPSLAHVVHPFSQAQAKDGLRLEFQGVGEVHWSVTRFWKDPSPVALARSGDLVVGRQYRKVNLVQDSSGQVREILVPFDGTLRLGEELEVTIELNSRFGENYLMVEDRFPAGMAISRSGFERLQKWGSWLAFGESKTDRMSWFVSEVRPGIVRFGYRLRAKHPGVYHALPARAELMYRPTANANSDEGVVRIEGK